MYICIIILLDKHMQITCISKCKLTFKKLISVYIYIDVQRGWRFQMYEEQSLRYTLRNGGY